MYQGGKTFISNTDGDEKVQKRGRDENSQNPTPLQNNASLLSGLQCNALAFLVCFVTCTTKQTTAVADVENLKGGGNAVN